MSEEGVPLVGGAIQNVSDDESDDESDVDLCVICYEFPHLGVRFDCNCSGKLCHTIGRSNCLNKVLARCRLRQGLFGQGFHLTWMDDISLLRYRDGSEIPPNTKVVRCPHCTQDVGNVRHIENRMVLNSKKRICDFQGHDNVNCRFRGDYYDMLDHMGPAVQNFVADLELPSDVDSWGNW